ncbi:MAG: three-Cys-motif partner protein TcmP [Spirochaetia bacterium]|jgi:three-Cys-motif partner protein|nr:three-Cys-motif partner protein TcmP [Spirochaetia bacterium]
MGSSTTENFFTNAKPRWSYIKDDLLRCYLRGYTNKILKTRKPIIYIDGFAGSGLFEGKSVAPQIAITDGKIPSCWGSPLIALKTLELAAKESKTENPRFYPIFIEKKYYDQLKNNVNNSQFSDMDLSIVHGDFKDVISDIIEKLAESSKRYNLFCYIDPFGIRDLKMTLLKKLKKANFFTMELLINFNSFGFFRSACALYKVNVRELEIVRENEGLDNSSIEYHSASKQFFDEIMQCNDWYNIILDYKNNIIDGYQAEQKIAELYKMQLMTEMPMNYVLDIPIRFDESKHPKYRMIYATMSEDGVLLMADVMRKREEILFKCNANGDIQLTLFEQKDVYDPKPAFDAFMAILGNRKEKELKDLFVDFYTQFGLIPWTRCEFVKMLEKADKIVIRRIPPVKKNGMPTAFYTEGPSREIYIKKKG